MFTIMVFAVLIGLMMIRIPIAFALGITTTLGLLIHGINLEVLVQRMFTSNASFSLLAIPFFILAGEIMTVGGVSRRLVDFAGSLVSHFRGGLGAVAILASTFFAAISGSNAATVAAVGGVMSPSMVKKGYSSQHTAAIVAAAGVVGTIIPPSILLILYGVIAGVSIGDLFIAGLLPGLLICVSFLIYNYFSSKSLNIENIPWQGFGSVWVNFKKAFWALMMPIVVLGGIYAGIFTPTEAAVVAVIYGIIVGFAYRELTFKNISNSFVKATFSSAIVMFVMNNAGVFAWFITYNRIPQDIIEVMSTVVQGKVLFIIVVNILLLIVGCFMNAAAAITIVTSILYPVAMEFGVDPITFGIIMVVNLSIGTITPPLGVDLFVASTVTGVSLEKIVARIWPFFLVLIIDLLIISFYPPLSTFLVELIGG